MSVELFGVSLIEQYLRTQKLSYTVNSEGDIFVRFGSEGSAPGVDFLMSADGEERDIYLVRATTSEVYPQSMRARIQEFADTWNRTKRWPKVFTTVVDGRGIRVVGEGSWPLRTGISRALFDDLTHMALACGIALFNELHSQELLPTADELEAWIRGADPRTT